MMIVGAQRLEELEKLNLTGSLLKLTRGEFVHEDLEFCCQEVKYSLEPEDFSPVGIDVIPLWESELSITGFYLEDRQPVFISYHVDEVDSPTVIDNSISDLINYLVTEYGENERELRNVLLK